MVIQWISGIILVILAMIYDLKTYRISNKMIVPFMIFGLIMNFSLEGFNGIKDSLLGLILPICLLFFFFAARMLGAGDIKLFSAVGAILGVKNVSYIMMYSFLCGGMMALLLLLMQKNIKERFNYFWNYTSLCIANNKLLPYTSFQIKSSGKFRFSYAIIGGTLVQFIKYLNCFERGVQVL